MTAQFNMWLDRFHAAKNFRLVFTRDELFAAWSERCSPTDVASRNDELVLEYDN